MTGVDHEGARLASLLADELVALARSLGDLAGDLGSSPETLRRHITSIQSIDYITQTQLAIAELLRSDGPLDRRLTAIPLEGLAARLRAGLGGGEAAPEGCPQEEADDSIFFD